MRPETEELFHMGALDLEQVRQRLYTAPQARERERWHALWLLGQGWTPQQIAQALGHDAHTLGNWIEGFRQHGPSSRQETAQGGAPPALTADDQAALKAAVHAASRSAGVAAASWSWKSVRQFVQARVGKHVIPRRCVRYLHRLGFV